MRSRQYLPLLGVLAAVGFASSLLLGQQASAQYPPTIGSLTASANPSPASTTSTADITCTVRDTSGQPTAGEPCTFTITSQPGDDAAIGSLSVTKATNSQGIAVATLRTGSTPGTIVVSVEARGISSQVSVTVQGEGAPASLPATGAAPADDSGSSGFLLWLAVGLGLAAALGAAGFACARVARRQS